jgi:hypothetical protein
MHHEAREDVHTVAALEGGRLAVQFGLADEDHEQRLAPLLKVIVRRAATRIHSC